MRVHVPMILFAVRLFAQILWFRDDQCSWIKNLVEPKLDFYQIGISYRFPPIKLTQFNPYYSKMSSSDQVQGYLWPRTVTDHHGRSWSSPEMSKPIKETSIKGGFLENNFLIKKLHAACKFMSQLRILWLFFKSGRFSWTYFRPHWGRPFQNSCSRLDLKVETIRKRTQKSFA